jgi:hypothetical protein
MGRAAIPVRTGRSRHRRCGLASLSLGASGVAAQNPSKYIAPVTGIRGNRARRQEFALIIGGE